MSWLEFHSWNACLYIPLKIIVLMYNHESTRFPYLSVNRHCGIYITSLGTDSQFQTMRMIIPKLGWGQHADVRMYILMTAQFYSRIGNQASTLPEYWQPIPQKCSYVHLTSLEYFSVSLSGQGQQIIPDVVMSWVFTIASNSNVSALMVIVLTLLIKYKRSSQLFLSKMNNHPFPLWNIDQGNCLRLLILFVTWSIHLTSLIWTGYIKYSSDYSTWPRRSDNVPYSQMEFTLIKLCLVPYAPPR